MKILRNLYNACYLDTEMILGKNISTLNRNVSANVLKDIDTNKRIST